MSHHHFAKATLAAVAAAGLSTAPGAQAQQAGDTIFSVGVARISPDAALGRVTSSDPTFNAALTGANARIDSATTATFGALHMFTDHLGAELTLGLPPTLDVDLTVPNGTPPINHPKAAKARTWTPALVGKWLFMEPGSRWRPYVGLGITYAYFDRIRINAADPLVTTLAGGSADLDPSWAPVYNAGIIYNFNDRWSINASVSYIPLKTDVTLRGGTAAPGVTTTSRLEINPTDYVVRIGYRF